MDRLKETEALLLQCQKDVKTLKKLHKTFKRLEQNQKKLDTYFRDDYMNDYDNPDFAELPYNILDQDSIWNVLTDFYTLKIKLLKTITKSL